MTTAAGRLRVYEGFEPCRVCGDSGNRVTLDGLDSRFYRVPLEPLCFPCWTWALSLRLDPAFRIARGEFSFFSEQLETWRRQ